MQVSAALMRIPMRTDVAQESAGRSPHSCATTQSSPATRLLDLILDSRASWHVDFQGGIFHLRGAGGSSIVNRQIDFHLVLRTFSYEQERQKRIAQSCRRAGKARENCNRFQSHHTSCACSSSSFRCEGKSPRACEKTRCSGTFSNSSQETRCPCACLSSGSRASDREIQGPCSRSGSNSRRRQVQNGSSGPGACSQICACSGAR